MVARRTNRRAARRGFTLIELTVVVLIIGILAAVAAPKFSSSLHRIRLDCACKRVKADLGWARATAIGESTAHTVQFTVGTGVYNLPAAADLDRSTQAYSVNLAVAPYQAVIHSAVLGSDAEVEFDHYGQPDSGGVITLRLGALTQTITIDALTGLSSIP